MDEWGALPGLGLAAYGVELPVGAVIAFAGDPTVQEWSTQNPNWLPCDGTTRQIADYPELYYALGSGSIYGGDTTTFTLPNYAAMFLRGVAAYGTGLNQDPGHRTAPSSSTSAYSVGSTQADMVQSHGHDYDKCVVATPFAAGEGGTPYGVLENELTTQTTTLLDPNGGNLTGKETRPKNTYVYYLIKAASYAGVVGVPAFGPAP